MQLCRWAKWSGSAQREAREVCEERRAEIRVGLGTQDGGNGGSWARQTPWCPAVPGLGSVWLCGGWNLLRGLKDGEGHSAHSRSSHGELDNPGFPNREEGRATRRLEFNHESACGAQRPQAALSNLASTLLQPIPHSFLQTLQLFQRYNKFLKSTRKKKKATAFQQSCTPKPRPAAAYGLQP